LLVKICIHGGLGQYEGPQEQEEQEEAGGNIGEMIASNVSKLDVNEAEVAKASIEAATLGPSNSNVDKVQILTKATDTVVSGPTKVDAAKEGSKRDTNKDSQKSTNIAVLGTLKSNFVKEKTTAEVDYQGAATQPSKAVVSGLSEPENHLDGATITGKKVTFEAVNEEVSSEMGVGSQSVEPSPN
jgi:hypothetical protein